MSATRLAYLTTLFLLSIPRTGLADEEHPCEWLTRHGMYDTEREDRESYTFSDLRRLVASSRAETVDQFRSEAERAGLSIPIVDAILSLTFGQSAAHKNFRAWKEDFSTSTYQQAMAVERNNSSMS